MNDHATNTDRIYEQILRGIKVVMLPGGFVYELRALHAHENKTDSGYFDDAEKLAQAALELDNEGIHRGIYITLNPVVPGLFKRAANCVRRNVGRGATTEDAQILCRYRLLVDFDPDRPSSKMCSTDAEKALALEAAEHTRERLQMDVSDKPVLCDSGSGYHLIYPIAWPNSPEALDMVERALQTIKAECVVTGVKVDTQVSNAARITRLYGSMNRKGDNTPERPHRRSGVIQ